MKKNNSTLNDTPIESGKNYFSTPNTSLDKQRQVASFESFDISNEPYRKSTSRVIVRRYTIK
jgi:hypothetical protein